MTTLGVEAVITQVEVSPLGVYVRIEGDALKGHHSWVPKNAPDGWYGCVEYQEILLCDTEGHVLTVDGVTSDCSGSGCSGGRRCIRFVLIHQHGLTGLYLDLIGLAIERNFIFHFT